MIFIYAFYIDLFLEQNFLMNLIVLSLTYTFCKNPVSMRHLRMFLAALCGAFAAAMLLVFGPGYGWAVAGQAFLLVPLMLYIAFGWNGRRAFLMRIGCSWTAIVILGGAADALGNLTGLRHLTFYAGLAALMIARFAVELLIAAARKQGKLYPVLFVQGTSQVRCLGLFDTGNLLSIPDTGEPVHIVSPAVVRKLGLDGDGGLRMIPFCALGTQQGFIRVAQVEELRVYIGKEKRKYCNAWLGVAEEGLLAGRSYQAILNGTDI